MLVGASPSEAAVAVHSGWVPSLQRLAGLNDSQMRAVQRYGDYVQQQRRQGTMAAQAVRYATAQLGKPYRFGAAGPDAFDCSGLTMRAWGTAGVHLAHYVPTQYQQVRVKVPISQIKAGDLLMFDGDGHVGIAIGAKRFIDAPQTGENVRVDALSGWYRSNFDGAVRPAAPAPESFSPGVPHDYQDVEWWRQWMAGSQEGVDRP